MWVNGKSTLSAVCWLVALVVLLLIAQPLVDLTLYLLALGWSFWSTVLIWGTLSAETIIYLITRRGLAYWVGKGLVAASPVLGVGFWFHLALDLAGEVKDRASVAARESLGTLPATLPVGNDSVQ